ncbi:hypothetical protein JX266_012500 [Neoarthrinium moseri]|nr:hypothetical protein JX266_012500 [Neoarthrinium moseri]
MCGPQTPRPSQNLGGALAVLSCSPESQTPFSGSLVFHSRPGSSSSSSSSPELGATMATHATFTPSSSAEDDAWSLDGCVVGIHATGDLRSSSSSLSEQALLHSFDFGRARPALAARRSGGGSMEVLLARPLEIGVGGDGIIGRKVTVWRTEAGGARVAEGIVGFN